MTGGVSSVIFRTKPDRGKLMSPYALTSILVCTDTDSRITYSRKRIAEIVSVVKNDGAG